VYLKISIVSKISVLIKEISSELLIIFLFLFLLNNLIGKQDSKISADGIGYYDYLPSLFIHSDFVRNNKSINIDSSFYTRINSLNIYNEYKDKKLNKYPCGTSILQSPFFLYTYFTSVDDDKNLSGYENSFQKTIFHAAIFYLFFGIYFLKKLLELYHIEKSIISFIQLLIVLGTSLVHYVNIDPAYSHIYSFFSISVFLYFSKMYFSFKKEKYFLVASLILGLIIILRQINVVIIFFIPFLSGSLNVFFEGLKSVFQKRYLLFSGILILISIVSIQCFVWYFQIGEFIVYSYQEEGFNFLKPELYNILFSYRKGLYVYTPILFIATLSVFWLAFKKRYFLFFSWVFFFSFLSYLFSSWWCWFYGASFGLRAYIEFYAIFCIPFAIFLNDINRILRLFIILISSLTIPLNLIQAYQYKEFILHWTLMDKEKYWNIFLKTQDKFKGYIWKINKNLQDYVIEKEIHFGEIKLDKFSSKSIDLSSDSICNFNKVSLIEITFEDEFNENSESKVLVCVNDENKKSVYWHEINLIHFSDNELNKYQEGKYDFEFKPTEKRDNQSILIYFSTQDETIQLKNVSVKFLSLR
jgi:hypothetical protein